MQKKLDFSIFKFVERPLNIFCQAKSFARSIFLPKGTKFSGETKNLKMKVKFGSLYSSYIKTCCNFQANFLTVNVNCCNFEEDERWVTYRERGWERWTGGWLSAANWPPSWRTGPLRRFSFLLKQYKDAPINQAVYFL